MDTYLIALLLGIVTAPELMMILFFETITKSVFSAFLMAVAISIGGTFGFMVIYLVVRLVGHDCCQELVRTHGKKVLLKPSDLKIINYYHERWGDFIVFFGRWLPTLRNLVSISAGLSRISSWRFFALTFLGTLSWNLILCSIIYGFEAYLDYLEVGFKRYTTLAFIAVLLLLAYFIVRRIKERIFKGAAGWNNDSDIKK